MLKNIGINTAEMLHFDIQGLVEEQCFGILEQEPIYEKGRLVNRLWHCMECGETYTEQELVEIEEEMKYENKCQVSGLY